MPYVSFVPDEQFRSIVLDILNVGRAAKDQSKAKFGRNVIDPFATLFEMGAFNLDFDSWHDSEIARQAQKTLSNQIGLFHQKLLGSISGWKDLGVGNGIDLVNDNRKIIAEVKNKHNTLKGSNKVDLYHELLSLVMPNGQQYKGYTAFYVEIIPKKAERFNSVFIPSDKKTSSRCHPNELIRQIDGYSFYALVTGVDNALEQVFNALPNVIKDCASSLTLVDANKANQYFRTAFVPKPQTPSRRSRR